MYDSLLVQGSQELLLARLTQAINRLRSLSITTKQDALSEIYSQINAALSLGNNTTPLKAITAYGPALIGDLVENCSILNQDAQAIIQQLLDTENDASGLYNSYASVQNTLRQAIRERLVASSAAVWQEQFVNDQQLQPNYSANIDFNAGVAASNLLTEVVLPPSSIKAGIHSQGEIASTSSFSYLTDGDPSTSLLWNGNQLDLLISFPQAQIVNLVKIELVGYQGLVVRTLSSTPDGVLTDDWLPEISSDTFSLDGNAGKYSGDWFAFVKPRHVQQLRIIIQDVIGTNQIELRNLTLLQRKYGTTGTFTTNPIQTPSGSVRFDVEASTVANLTTITHQISQDGVNYQTIVPGSTISVTAPYRYRAQLTRLDSNFRQASAPLTGATASNYTVSNVTTTDMGNGTLVRKVQFSTITGSVDLQELPQAQSLTLYSGNSPVDSSTYSLTGTVLSVTPTLTNVLLTYQVSAYDIAGLRARQNYYTPLLSSVRFSGA